MSAKNSGWRGFFLPRVTKQSVHVYGSEGAVQRECRRQTETSSWVIHAFSAIRNHYITVMLILTFLNLLAIPKGVAFVDDLQHFRAWEIFNLFSDTVFVLDILVNFRMGVITDERVILNPKEIRHHYLKSWFALDMISAFPLDYIILIAKVILNVFIVYYLSCKLDLPCVPYSRALLSVFVTYTYAYFFDFKPQAPVLKSHQCRYTLFLYVADETELWVVMTSMVAGALMYTLMVANIAAVMTSGDAPSKAYRSKVCFL
ncbi:HCN4 protein, partial [Amia calva]|nr:HCN4 protein [Amia calva]